MADYQVRVLPEVEDFMEDLPAILTHEGYKNTYENALKMLDEIIGFIRQLPLTLHYPVPPEFAYHYVRYGSPSHYAFFRRKSSPRTTWYIFFSKEDDRIVVKHITTNWLEGQYVT